MVTPSLWSAIQTTEAGKHANAIDGVLYDHSGAIGQEKCKALRAAHMYLEQLALEELRKTVPEWADELLKITRRQTAQPQRSEEAMRNF